MSGEILELSDFWKQISDATGKKSGSTNLKIFTAIRMLSDNCSAFLIVNEVRYSKPQNMMKCLKLLCQQICVLYKGEWLHRPNTVELAKIVRSFRKIDLLGCAGAVDCARWIWKNCPVAWQGLFSGTDWKPRCRMELVCDDNLQIGTRTLAFKHQRMTLL